ncbi:phosphatase PAP2 family protein [Paractinoplanes lichenicola]|uniref:Phosphatase PAP2 family protein n=1 Tax=Paractinoplanes lichenicola TaxID=2802976 RepID=A0ABS1VV91_9ACTN|nr:phosphatase PAP2 family protein [Actinoplanes lichenicola]MBL7258396.1 phosphatase PAP2 family protein [Actinoplanes lichenicola]
MTTVLASPQQAAPTRPRGARHLLAPIAIALLAAVAAGALYQVFVRTTLGQRVDTIAMRGADVHHPRVVEVLDRTLNGTSLASLVLVCLFAAVFGVLRRRLDLALGAALLVIGANVTTQLMKTHLTRPDLDGFAMPNSFPSGHTTAAASVAFAVVLVLPQALRGMVALVGLAYVSVIAIATVWAEWHRPSDTVAALAVTTAWGALAVFLIRVRRWNAPGGTQPPSRLVTLPLLAIAGVAGAAGLVGLAAVTMSERSMPDLVSGRFAFLTGSASIAAAAAVVFLVWVRLAAGDKLVAETPVEPAPKKSGVPAAAGRRVKGGTK